MHDYTVRLLNEQRLDQFDAEADASRLVSQARKRRGPPGQPESIRMFMTRSVPRSAVQHVHRVFMRVRGA